MKERIEKIIYMICHYICGALGGERLLITTVPKDL